MPPWSSLPPVRRWLRHGLLCCVLVLAGVTFQERVGYSSRQPRDAVAEQATPESVAPLFEAPAVQRSRHLAQLGVERWHKDFGRGQGVTIAVLDSGFRGYHNFLGKGLPAQLQVKSFRKDGNLEARDSQHGILCAEVLHALAPEARLLLATWENDDPQAFLEAARWAKGQGARILSCSLIMPSWSDGEGGGPIHLALNQILGSGAKPGDLLCFASAGNIAQRHWHGPFRPDDSGRHQWAPGHTSNRLKPWDADRVAVELYGPLTGTYELQVYTSQTGKSVGQATLQKKVTGDSGWGSAVVRFDPDPGHSYQVCIRGGPTPPFQRGGSGGNGEKFHLAVLGGTLERHTSRGSIPFPGDGARVDAVGAVDEDGQRLFYSSCGPNSKEPKPDLVARVPFASLCRARPFAGTSAAAPQAAGLAALVWSRHPDWTADQVRAYLRRHAHDLGPPGHDWETGFGLIRLP